MHSFTFRDHELAIGKLATEIGFTHISLSAELSPIVKIVPRGNSSTADAYLTPEIKRYLAGFEAGFENLRTSGCRCEFMQSDGGLVEFGGLSGLRSLLSGPAGGVIGYARTCYDEKNNTPVIGFDMGGTSTDVSRYINLDTHYSLLVAAVLRFLTRLMLDTWANWNRCLRPPPRV